MLRFERAILGTLVVIGFMSGCDGRAYDGLAHRHYSEHQHSEILAFASGPGLLGRWDAFVLPGSIDVFQVEYAVPETEKEKRFRASESRLTWHRVGPSGDAQLVGTGLGSEIGGDIFLEYSTFCMTFNWDVKTATLDVFFLRDLSVPGLDGVVNWLAVPERTWGRPGQIRRSEAPEHSRIRNSRLVYMIDNSLSINEFAGRSWVTAESFEQGVWVGSLDDMVPYMEAFADQDEIYTQLAEEDIIGPGGFPVAVSVGERACILALQYLGPARVRTMAKRLKSVIAYESSDMESWSAVEAVAIGDDDVLKLAACRLDDTTDRVVVFLQKTGGVFKLIVLDGELGQRLDEWEFTSPELADAIAADVHVRTRKIDLAVQDGTVYAFWDHYIGEFGARTSSLRYVLWRPDMPAGEEEPQAGPDVSATSPAQTDPAGVGETSGRQE